MEKTQFYFAKYTVQGSVPVHMEERSSKASILEYMKSPGPVLRDEKSGEKNDEEWYFGDVRQSGEIIVGKFGRSYSDSGAVYDEGEGDFEDEAVSTEKAEYAMFLLDTENQLLIYHTRNRLRHQLFRRKFAEGYDAYMGGAASLETSLIRNKQNPDKIVSEYPVRRAEFRLRPSNPSPDRAWEDLDDGIRMMLARKLGVEVESMDERGLNFNEDLLDKLYEMSKSEYGEHELVYEQDGELRLVSSASGQAVKTEDDLPKSIEHLLSRAQRLIDHALSFL